MKICFVGVGSIAKRHIKNLSLVKEELNIEISIEALRRESSEADDLPEGVNKVYTSIEKLPKDYDAIFLTNPTRSHADMLIALHDHAKHFFIEKPIASLDTVDKLSDFAFRKDSVYYVACPMRYSNVIRYLRKNIDVRTVRSVRCISSSFLPEWRPGIDYRTTYSAQKEMGGGVDVDLIHEWDYLTYLFGMPTRVKHFSGKISNLGIDSNDYAIYIAQFGPNMIGEVHLDYFGRKSIRRIELFTDEDTIAGDLIEGKVTYLKSGKLIDLYEDRDGFQTRELLYFFDMIINGSENGNDVTNAIEVLKLTQGEI